MAADAPLRALELAELLRVEEQSEWTRRNFAALRRDAYQEGVFKPRIEAAKALAADKAFDEAFAALPSAEDAMTSAQVGWIRETGAAIGQSWVKDEIESLREASKNDPVAGRQQLQAIEARIDEVNLKDPALWRDNARRVWVGEALYRLKDAALVDEALAVVAAHPDLFEGRSAIKSALLLNKDALTQKEVRDIGMAYQFGRKMGRGPLYWRLAAKLADSPAVDDLTSQGLSLAWVQLWACIDTGRFKKADRIIERLARGGFAEVPYARVYTLYRQKRHAEAIALADQYTASPGNLESRGMVFIEAYMWALWYKKESHEALGQTDEARATCQRIVAEYPDSRWSDMANAWLRTH